MAHEVEQMAYTNEKPWHGLGNHLPAGKSIDDWRKAAGLDWEVERAPVEYEVGGEYRVFDDREVLYRTDNNRGLGLVSTRYRIVQPGEVLEFFRDLCDQLKVFSMETAGSLRGGRRIWALAKASDSFALGKDDQVDRYLLLATSYDRSLPTIAQQTSIRVVCNNTLTAAFEAPRSRAQANEHQVRFTHLEHFSATLARERLMLDEQWAKFREVVQAMSKKKITDKQREKFFEACLFPPMKKERKSYSEKGAAKKIEYLQQLAVESPGADLRSAAGTVWGAVSAITYYLDHAIPVKGLEDKVEAQGRRIDNSWFGANQRIKERAINAALKLIA